MSLTQAELEQVADGVAARIMESKRAQWVDPQTHAEHHDWCKAKISGEDDLRKLKRRIVASACIWAVPLILAFVFSAIWRDVVQRITHP